MQLDSFKNFLSFLENLSYIEFRKICFDGRHDYCIEGYFSELRNNPGRGFLGFSTDLQEKLYINFKSKKGPNPSAPSVVIEFRGKYGEFCHQTLMSIGADLPSQEYAVIVPGTSQKIPTGVYISNPFKSAEGLLPGLEVRARSSIDARRIMTGHGTIDPDYEGQLHVTLHNMSTSPFEVQPGDRVAQLVLGEFRQFARIKLKKRGDGGFGSTNKS